MAFRNESLANFARYHPKPTVREPCEQQKIRLQAKMSGIEAIDESDCDSKLLEKGTKSNEEDEIDMIDECKLNFFHIYDPIFHMLFFSVLNEISERAEWLNEMEALGEGKKHRTMIMNQIAERMRMIKKIEKERASKEK